MNNAGGWKNAGIMMMMKEEEDDDLGVVVQNIL